MLRLWETKDRLSILALILANLAPLAGVFLWGWGAGAIVLLYWVENLIVGLYNVMKIALAKPDDSVRDEFGMAAVPFFCVHYGGFCFAHGIFVLLLASAAKGGEPSMERVPVLFGQILWPSLGLLISHGVSFVMNTLVHQEYKTLTVRKQVWQPYGRIAVLHIGILLAMFVLMPLGTSAALLAALVVVKTGADVYLYARAHRPPATANADSEAPGAPPQESP